MNNDFVKEESVSFYDPSFFGDKESHFYDVECYDGIALGKLINPEQDKNAPLSIYIVYPLMKDVLENTTLTLDIMKYRGILYFDEVTFGDIMVFIGEIER